MSAWRPLYFGCGPHDTGHHLWCVRAGALRMLGGVPSSLECPWGDADLDGGLQPRLPHPPGSSRHFPAPEAPQGVFAHHVKDGWTCVAWWDRSADTRGASCSALVLRGEHSAGAVIEAGRAAFPWAFERMRFALVEGRP